MDTAPTQLGQRSPVICSIDEGTTGTRAALVATDGSVGPQEYRSVGVHTPDHLRVEQDPEEILASTLACVDALVAGANAQNVRLSGVTVSVQRATAVLWDAATGRAFGPAVVWQDRRFARELDDWGAQWDEHLIRVTGRPVGSRQPLLWASRQILQNPALAECLRRGDLRFGGIDSWLIWHLTGGAVHAISTTNAVAMGALDLESGDWHHRWVQHLGTPSEILPQVLDDNGDFGIIAGHPVLEGLPVLSAMGDQHSALVALGASRPGDAVCVHGTGTFVESVVGDQGPPPISTEPGLLTLIGWRADSRNLYSLEAFAATTGSALRWLCDDLGLFANPREIAQAATEFEGIPGALFVPTLAGLRYPAWVPEARGVLDGLSLSTTRAEVAAGVLYGIAHSVTDLVEAINRIQSQPVTGIRVAGGLAASDVLLQAQADLTGLPAQRVDGHDSASLRGVAYLGGVKAGMWSSAQDIAGAQGVCDQVLPRISGRERHRERARWHELLASRIPAPAPGHHMTDTTDDCVALSAQKGSLT